MKKVKKISLTLNKKIISKLQEQKIAGGSMPSHMCVSNIPDDPTIPMHPTRETNPAAGCGC
ncbi:MAG: hypothetical protein WBG90_00940 [Saonia sp.]